MPAPPRQTAPYGASQEEKQRKTTHGMRVRSEETATDALHTQTGAAAAGAWAGGGPSGAAVRHSPQRSVCGRLHPSAHRAQDRSRKQDHGDGAGSRRSHRGRGGASRTLALRGAAPGPNGSRQESHAGQRPQTPTQRQSETPSAPIRQPEDPAGLAAPLDLEPCWQCCHLGAQAHPLVACHPARGRACALRHAVASEPGNRRSAISARRACRMGSTCLPAHQVCVPMCLLWQDRCPF